MLRTPYLRPGTTYTLLKFWGTLFLVSRYFSNSGKLDILNPTITVFSALPLPLLRLNVDVTRTTVRAKVTKKIQIFPFYSQTDRREVHKGRCPKPKRRIIRLLFAPTKLVVKRAKRHQSGNDRQTSNIVRWQGAAEYSQELEEEQDKAAQDGELRGWLKQTFNYHVTGNSDHGAFVVAGRTDQARRVGGNQGIDEVH